jgi:hypothetical protein
MANEELDRARALTFAAALLSDVPAEEIDPGLRDGPTEAERLLATAVARGVVESGARALARAGVLGRQRTPFDLTLRELHALAAICSQVEPWLRLEVMRGKTLRDVLDREDVSPRIKENVACLMSWAGWIDAPEARFRLTEDGCDDGTT